MMRIMRKGSRFPPVILLTSDAGETVILEGHVRMTVYGMMPGTVNGATALVGFTSKENLARFDRLMAERMLP